MSIFEYWKWNDFFCFSLKLIKCSTNCMVNIIVGSVGVLIVYTIAAFKNKIFSGAYKSHVIWKESLIDLYLLTTYYHSKSIMVSIHFEALKTKCILNKSVWYGLVAPKANNKFYYIAEIEKIAIIYERLCVTHRWASQIKCAFHSKHNQIKSIEGKITNALDVYVYWNVNLF